MFLARAFPPLAPPSLPKSRAASLFSSSVMEVILAWAIRHDKPEGLEPQVLSPKHLPYTAHNPTHLVLAKRPNPLHETHFVYGNNLRNVDDARFWQVAVAFVEFNVTRIIGTVWSCGRSADHYGIYGACVEDVTLNDYSRATEARLRPKRRAEIYPEYITLPNRYSSLLRRRPNCPAAWSRSSFSSGSSPSP